MFYLASSRIRIRKLRMFWYLSKIPHVCKSIYNPEDKMNTCISILAVEYWQGITADRFLGNSSVNTDEKEKIVAIRYTAPAGTWGWFLHLVFLSVRWQYMLLS